MADKNHILRGITETATAFSVALLFVALTASPAIALEEAADVPSEQEMADISQPPPAETPAAVEGEIGSATYYGKRFAGRRTASGEIFDPELLTAAHTDLPFGTRVRVVNLANGLEVVVTVNDRCRPRSAPFIDVSRRAAREIGFLGKGTARVRIIPLEPEQAPAEDPAEAEDTTAERPLQEDLPVPQPEGNTGDGQEQRGTLPANE